MSEFQEDPSGEAADEASDAGLVVFSDDWGRHPSSCQHLIGQLLDRYPTLWVNTIGTRPPRLDLLTLRRSLGKMRAWLRQAGPPSKLRAEGGPRVLEPIMWPSFRSGPGRRLNRAQLTRVVGRALSDLPVGRRIAVTTIPVVADLVGHLEVDRWVYYCVDDLSEWPGLDGRCLRESENRLVERADAIIAVSDRLVASMAARGREATLLTHGVDLQHWIGKEDSIAAALEPLSEPRIVFWGLIDRRLDTSWLDHLGRSLGGGSIVLIGPRNNPDPLLESIPHVSCVGPLAYELLPSAARSASVLIMPYADLPATRAMQPLKLKEYLATGRPVVTSRLPAVGEWSDACDVVGSAEAFARAVRMRLETGIPEDQRAARRRLAAESWRHKARRFEDILLGEGRSAESARGEARE